MNPTMWIDDLSGRRLNEAELHDARVRARRSYRANTHIFEDEAEALLALGIVPMCVDSAFRAGLAGACRIKSACDTDGRGAQLGA